MHVVSDLHLHSKYSRAVSKDMVLPVMAQVAKQKGIDVLSTGDWTHPLWLREIWQQLEEAEEGLFELKDKGLGINDKGSVRFFLSVEIASIYSQAGQVHRIHNLVFSPSFATSEKINKSLIQRGCNLMADGRPIIGLSSEALLELILEIDERAMLIPAHIWTPWFSLYGANSGFDRLEDCFGKYSAKIYGIETGLSSDPEMNWQINDLQSRSILSFSDAHSPAKMGRELTVFELENLSYENIRKAIIAQSLSVISNEVREPIVLQKSQGVSRVARDDNKDRVLYTIEFYPEEGKYHYNGHRNCNVIETPEQTRAQHSICPVCKRKITVGVMQRVEDLANEKIQGIRQENKQGLVWIKDATGKHPPFVKVVPLLEIIAEAVGTQVGSQKVKDVFTKLCNELGSELDILLKIPIEEIAKTSNEKVAEGVKKVRAGNIVIKPGYDGVYGVVKIWHEEKESKATDNSTEIQKTQLGLEF